mmetsp:Transcript_4107/g.12348  ORF Transcript_4107/g.12348 Transcript_4107/m.12348 type:complete len:165 (+) Transcript_4107:1199-1693(+)
MLGRCRRPSFLFGPVWTQLVSSSSSENLIHRVGRVGRSGRSAQAFVLAANEPEKVWFHRCKKPTSCQNEDTCAIWINEWGLFEKSEKKLHGVFERVQFPSYGCGQASVRSAGEREYQQVLARRTKHLQPATRRLGNLEDAAQFYYISNLRANQRKFPPGKTTPE